MIWALPDPNRPSEAESLGARFRDHAAPVPCDLGPDQTPWGCPGESRYHEGPRRPAPMPKRRPAADPRDEARLAALYPPEPTRAALADYEAFLAEDATDSSDRTPCSGRAVELDALTWPAYGIGIFVCAAHAGWLRRHGWVNEVDSGTVLALGTDQIWRSPSSAHLGSSGPP